ncbi:cactin [Cordyceps javanica]|uniref:Splicing factor Cactin n=1 Tax=Cordyceps javanica TaxID=43265 RepID=A0A545V3Q8_9HYPO|nr:cactin [Cordyceps javanica]TQW07640.1 cactin [Cordyceps javanica]
MDPGRQNMINGSGPSRVRDGTSPKYDSHNRISKSSRRGPRQSANKAAASYVSNEEQARQFVADEDKFVLRQSKKKADIRVRENRAKPIDYLAFSLRYIDDERDAFDDEAGDDDIDVPEPADIVQNLSLEGLRELEADIKHYHVLETEPRNREYWEALRSLCKSQKAKLDPSKYDRRVVSSVDDDINKILAPKTYEQLGALEKQIQTKLRSDEDIDMDYWEQLLQSLLVWKAKAVLARTVDKITKRKLERRGPSLGKEGSDTGSAPAQTQAQPSSSSSSAPNAPPAEPSGGNNADASKATQTLYDREAARGVSENEEVFAAEEELPGTSSSSSKPQWAGEHRVRKPRYFNRVQMGYEWNKYNQTHYDHDNPPPKVVQGYKFNIFYPELVDKTKAPTFKIIREHGRRRGESFAAAGEEDTCLIRFIAGPPYEDIAFRIVDREWDYSAKRDRGFRSSFDKGILQLHFQFKKIFYRK